MGERSFFDDGQVGVACTRSTNVLPFTTFTLYRICIGGLHVMLGLHTMGFWIDLGSNPQNFEVAYL